MARTLEEIRASKPRADRAKMAAITEADIRRQMIADGEDPDLPFPDFKLVKRRPGQRGPGSKPSKEAVQLRLDPAALAAWRASGPGWQTRMGEVLVREAPKEKRRT